MLILVITHLHRGYGYNIYRVYKTRTVYLQKGYPCIFFDIASRTGVNKLQV